MRSELASDRQTSVRLPGALYERLVTAAGKGGIGEEIRDRLEQSFGCDERTAELIKLITALASSVERDAGASWHSDPIAFATFSAGLSAILEALKPAGDTETRGGDDPATIGRTLARVTLQQLADFWKQPFVAPRGVRKAYYRIKK